MAHLPTFTAVTVVEWGRGVADDLSEDARRFLEFILGEEAQTYFREETAEYPVAGGVDALTCRFGRRAQDACCDARLVLHCRATRFPPPGLPRASGSAA